MLSRIRPCRWVYRIGPISKASRARPTILAMFSSSRASASYKNHVSLNAATEQQVSVEVISEEHWIHRATKDLKDKGMAVLPFELSGNWVAEAKAHAEKSFEDCMQLAKDKDYRVDVGMDNGLAELVQRAPGRYDMLYGVNQQPLYEEAATVWQPLITEVVGGGSRDGAKLQFNGLLNTLPGAGEQAWHVDGEHLFTDSVANMDALPPHCVNVFVPLVDLTAENGGTEFCYGSHKLTAKGGEDIVWQDPKWKEEIGWEGDPSRVFLKAGSVLIFDYRVLHRGLAHTGTEPRPMLYWTYTRRWFSDTLNFPARSLIGLRGVNEVASEARKCFPAVLEGERQGHIFADGAAGTQVPRQVVDAIAHHLVNDNANVGAIYDASVAAEATTALARRNVAAFLGCTPAEVVFGMNTTSLFFHISAALRRSLSFQTGDNIVVSMKDHDANVAPWLLLAEATGCEVRWVQVDKKRGAITTQPSEVIDDRTRLVAMSLASNVTGTINKNPCEWSAAAANVNAISVFDATHFAPHRRLDVQALGCDFLVCSPYKFFGPHTGVMYGRRQALMEMLVPRVRPSMDALPSAETCQMHKWELGTPNYEGLAGIAACVQYLASFGEEDGSLAERLDQGLWRIFQYEKELSRRFLEGFRGISNVELFGLNLDGSQSDDEIVKQRTPTFAFRSTAGISSAELAKRMNLCGIRCSAGNHYAPGLVHESLGVAEDGLCRVGFMHYNTENDVDSVLAAIVKAASTE